MNTDDQGELFPKEQDTTLWFDPHTGETKVGSPSGRYSGPNPTVTEKASGDAVEARELGPLRKNSAGHKVLAVFAEASWQMSAYEASYRASGDYHSKRREATRLLTRGFLEKNGVTRNPAPSGRQHVDAYKITAAGLKEYQRLEGLPDKPRLIAPDAPCLSCGHALQDHFPMPPAGCDGFKAFPS